MRIKDWLRFLWLKRVIIKKLLFNKVFFLSFFIWWLIWCVLVKLREEKRQENIREYFIKKVKKINESSREKSINEKRLKEKRINKLDENKTRSFFNNNFKIKWKRVRIRKINLLKREFFTIKILLKRRNLFLTLIDSKGDIIMKTNLGASGYKKRNKFTGDSLEGTTLTFFKNVREIILKKIKIKKKVKAYVTIYLKNCLKNWQYRFIKKGMWKARIFGKKVKLYALNNFSYNSHSKGLRTKKKRRV